MAPRPISFKIWKRSSVFPIMGVAGRRLILGEGRGGGNRRALPCGSHPGAAARADPIDAPGGLCYCSVYRKVIAAFYGFAFVYPQGGNLCQKNGRNPRTSAPS